MTSELKPFNNQSIDARDWAREFNRILVSKGNQPYDEGCLIGWFANAIMAGMDEQARRTRLEPKGLIELDEEKLYEILTAEFHRPGTTREQMFSNMVKAVCSTFGTKAVEAKGNAYDNNSNPIQYGYGGGTIGGD